jgi:hypothetical protein
MLDLLTSDPARRIPRAPSWTQGKTMIENKKAKIFYHSCLVFLREHILAINSWPSA